MKTMAILFLPVIFHANQLYSELAKISESMKSGTQFALDSSQTIKDNKFHCKEMNVEVHWTFLPRHTSISLLQGEITISKGVL